MEEVNINGNKWHKYKGDEGQDVYVAQFVVPSNELIGKYLVMIF